MSDKPSIRIVNIYERISVPRAIVSFVAAVLIFFSSVVLFSNLKPVELLDAWIVKDERIIKGFSQDGPLNFECDGKEAAFTDINNVKRGCKLSVGAEANMTFSTGRGGEIRLNEGTTIEVREFQPQLISIDIESENGSLWASNQVSNQDVDVVFPKAVVRSNASSTGLKWTANGFMVYSFGGLTRVDLYNGDYSPSNRSQNFVGSIFVPPHHQAEILYSRINENTAKLYYSKLVKDFVLSVTSDSEIDQNEWLSTNTSLDRDLEFKRRQSLKKYVQEIVDSSPFVVRSSSIYKISESLTFSEKKNTERLNQRFNYLVAKMSMAKMNNDDSLYLESKNEIIDFLSSAFLTDIADERRALISSSSNLWDEALIVAFGDDNLEETRASLRLLSEQAGLYDDRSVFDESMARLLYVFRLTEIDRSKAKEHLLSLNRFTSSRLPQLSDPILRENLDSLRSYRNLLESVVNRNDYYLDRSYFGGLVFINKTIVDLSEDDDVKNEQTQAAIQSYLKTTAKVVSIIKSGEGVAESAFGQYLIARINELQPEKIKDAAVTEFFLSETRRLQLELEFLNSSSFKALSKKAYTRNEYETALSEFGRVQEERARLNEILGATREDEVKPSDISLSLEQSRGSAIAILRSNGIAFEALEVEAENPRNVKIMNGQYAGITFNGLLDVRTEFVYDLVIDGSRLTAGIRASDLPSFLESAQELLSKPEEEVKDPGSPVVSKQESLLDSVLIQLTQERMKSFGLNVGAIAIKDRKNEIVQISDVQFPEEVSASFSYDLRKNNFADIVVDGERFPGVFTIVELETIVAKKQDEKRSKKLEELKRIQAEKDREAAENALFEGDSPEASES